MKTFKDILDYPLLSYPLMDKTDDDLVEELKNTKDFGLYTLGEQKVRFVPL